MPDGGRERERNVFPFDGAANEPPEAPIASWQLGAILLSRRQQRLL